MVQENNDRAESSTSDERGKAEGVDAEGVDATGSVPAGAGTDGAGKDSLLHKLYVGTGAFNIVQNRKHWFLMFAALVTLCIVVIGVRGFNFGIDFEGGTQIQLPGQGAAGSISSDEAGRVVNDAVGQKPEEIQKVGTGAQTSIQIRSKTLDNSQVADAKQAIYNKLEPLGSNGEPDADAISVSDVSGSWGSQVSQQALIALGVFMVLVGVFLAIYFERWMAIAALLALAHDVFVIAGVYALVGLEVTPASVIGLLTVLGYSLYDTVVVFDKVKENTRGLLGLTRRTYPEAANLALNQTMMRSINTTIIAVLPVLGLLIVGYVLLGAGTLQQLAMVQLIGMVGGVLSSVLLATPLLVTFKMRDSKYREQAQRVHQRRRKANQQQAGEDTGTGGMDSDELDRELRNERAATAAAGVPARHPKSPPRGQRSQGQRSQGQRDRSQGKPSGKRQR